MKKPFKSTLMKTAFLFSLMALLASSANPALAAHNAGFEESNLQAIAPNDDINNAIVIAGIPYHLTDNNFEATTDVDDPAAPQCNLKAGLATVWYKFTPNANTFVHMDTIGNNYDSYLAVWTGTPGNLTSVACNDDANPVTTASAVDITLQSGITYYIEVAQFNGNSDADSLHKSVNGAGTEAVATHVFRLVQLYSKAFRSIGSQDGYISESTESSNVGLTKNATATTIRIGDDQNRRQYVGILSFNTEALPDNVTINYALLKVKRQSISANNIFSDFLGLKADLRKPYFGGSPALASGDFQAPATRTGAGAFNATAAAGWYSAMIGYNSLAYLNKTGYTQFRLRFAQGNDNDSVSDYLNVYSGNAATANKPVLIIHYYTP